MRFPDGKFRYPVDKRKIRENTEVMQAAERNLDSFWTKVDGQLVHKTSLFKHPTLRNFLSDERILHRTPDWEESDSARPANQRVDSIDELCRPLSQIYFGLEHRTQGTLTSEKTPVGKKSKVKTRGASQLAAQPADKTQQVETGPAHFHGGQARIQGLLDAILQAVAHRAAGQDPVERLSARDGSDGVCDREAVRVSLAVHAVATGCGANDPVP